MFTKMSDVLLVEPYFSGSHQAWAEGFKEASSHRVDVLTLPGRFWKWRMFGGSLTLAHRTRQLDVRPEVVVASDMVDLAAFAGHAGAALEGVPTVLYMHENQLTYPLSPTARDDLAYAYMNWSSMVRADEVWFNSQFHLDSVFEALPKFLRHFPDHRHLPLIDGVREKSAVMPVGVDLSWVRERPKSRPALIVWNQRWEHDKNPARMFAALARLAESGLDFRVAICGENFSNVPAEFDRGRDLLGKRVYHYGFAERERYLELLGEASVVLSTADHEFFGIAVVEAIAAGAVPVLPDALSYPELVPEEVHADTLYEDDDGLDSLLGRLVSDASRREMVASVVAPAMSRFSWDVVGPVYDERLSSLIG